MQARMGDASCLQHLPIKEVPVTSAFQRQTSHLWFAVLLPVPPLFVIEFLHRVMDTFEDYFNECTESTIKENYVIVYEVRNCNIRDYTIVEVLVEYELALG